MYIVTSQQMKRAEANAVRDGGSYDHLMARAGAAAAQVILEKYCAQNTQHVVVFCGSGNNGGDGLVVASALKKSGVSVCVILIEEHIKTPQSKAVFEKAVRDSIQVFFYNIDQEKTLLEISRASILVDGVFGTGFHDGFSETVATLFQLIEQSSAKKIALDIPSGVCADTGVVCAHAFCADETIVFGAKKVAHIIPTAMEQCGVITLVDISMKPQHFSGLHCTLTELDDPFLQQAIPLRKKHTHKGDYGKLLCICGSVGMSGAALLSTKAALRTGAGIVTLATPSAVATMLAPHMPEAITVPLIATEGGAIDKASVAKLIEKATQSTACLIGCGVGASEGIQQIVENLVETSENLLIIDADGINALQNRIDIIKTAKASIIITPHIGEMAHISGLTKQYIKQNAQKVAREFATTYQVTLVLKDSVTIVATPDGQLYVNTKGNAGMARGGSGDVLAGIIASLAAQGLSPKNAAGAGVYLHAVCGDLAAQKYSQQAMLPSDIIKMIPTLFQSMNR